MSEKKINFYEECKKVVENHVYLDVTNLVNYITKQEDFWEENQDCPIVYSDLECKEWEDEDHDSQMDWLCVYAVSDWLADELYERGEIVARYKYTPCLWFRQTYGQAIAIDGVIDQITRDLLVRIGDCTEEEAKKLSIC